MMGTEMYRQILTLTEEIEEAIPLDDHARLNELKARRAAAFAGLEAQGPHASPEVVGLIKKIQDCERRCRDLAVGKMAAIKKDMDEIRKGKRLGKAYGLIAT